MGNRNFRSARKTNAEPKRGSKKKDNTITNSIPLWLNHEHCDTECNHIVAKIEWNEKEQKVIDKLNKSIKSALKLIFENIGVYSFIKSYQDALFELMNIGIEDNYKGSGAIFVEIKESIRLNTWYWSASKNLEIVNQLNELATISGSFKEFQASVSTIVDNFNKNYLLTEYQLVQQASVELSKHIQRVENADIFPFVRWKQIDRKNKRPEHEALDGMVFDVKSVPLIPPIGWNCGCRLIEMDDYNGNITSKTEFENALKNTVINKKGETEWERMQKYGFDVNRYDERIIFADQQFYVPKNEAIRFVNDNEIKMP